MSPVVIVGVAFVMAVILGCAGYITAASLRANAVGRTGRTVEGNGQTVFAYGLLGLTAGAVLGVALTLWMLT